MEDSKRVTRRNMTQRSIVKKEKQVKKNKKATEERKEVKKMNEKDY